MLRLSGIPDVKGASRFRLEVMNAILPCRRDSPRCSRQTRKGATPLLADRGQGWRSHRPPALAQVARFPAFPRAPDTGQSGGDLLAVPEAQNRFEHDGLARLRIGDLPPDPQELWCLPRPHDRPPFGAASPELHEPATTGNQLWGRT